MIDYEEIRQRYRPSNLKVLFIAESPPRGDIFFYSAKSFFYIYTKKVLGDFYKEEMNLNNGFLNFFKEKGCFLDDLCHTTANFNEINFNQKLYIEKLSKRLNIYQPKQ